MTNPSGRKLIGSEKEKRERKKAINNDHYVLPETAKDFAWELTQDAAAGATLATQTRAQDRDMKAGAEKGVMIDEAGVTDPEQERSHLEKKDR